MTASVTQLPVRIAETLNRVGSSPVERSGPEAAGYRLALVTLGHRSFVARAYRDRVTRRGRQTLVLAHGRLTWVSSRWVQILDDDHVD